MTDAQKDQDTSRPSNPSNDGGNSPMRDPNGQQKPQTDDQPGTGSHGRPSDDEDEGHS